MAEEDYDLTMQAVLELQQDAARAKHRSTTLGATGWKRRIATANRVYLHNTILGNVQSNRRIDNKIKDNSPIANDLSDLNLENGKLTPVDFDIELLCSQPCVVENTDKEVSAGIESKEEIDMNSKRNNGHLDEENYCREDVSKPYLITTGTGGRNSDGDEEIPSHHIKEKANNHSDSDELLNHPSKSQKTERKVYLNGKEVILNQYSVSQEAARKKHSDSEDETSNQKLKTKKVKRQNLSDSWEEISSHFKPIKIKRRNDSDIKDEILSHSSKSKNKGRNNSNGGAEILNDPSKSKQNSRHNHSDGVPEVLAQLNSKIKNKDHLHDGEEILSDQHLNRKRAKDKYQSDSEEEISRHSSDGGKTKRKNYNDTESDKLNDELDNEKYMNRKLTSPRTPKDSRNDKSLSDSKSKSVKASLSKHSRLFSLALSGIKSENNLPVAIPVAKPVAKRSEQLSCRKVISKQEEFYSDRNRNRRTYNDNRRKFHGDKDNNSS